ncbi:MAG: hypothetical protein WD595_01995 [Waddliaceae bacterium]
MNKSIYNEIIKDIRLKSSSPPDDIKDLENLISHENKKRELENREKEQTISLQSRWSWIIGGVLGVSTFAIWVMVFLIGFGILDFGNYSWLPHTAMVTFFGEVVALGLVVANCLFPKADNNS